MKAVAITKSNLLIAMPQLLDPNFSHAVVLMIHHDEKGAMGLIINKPIPVNLGDFAKDQDIPCTKELAQVPLFNGGPVEPEKGWILHDDRSVEEKQTLLPGVFLSGAEQTLHRLLAEGTAKVHFILGYAGWDAEQLEAEMMQGAWLNGEARSDYIFEVSPNQLWKKVIKDLGVDPATLSMVTGVH